MLLYRHKREDLGLALKKPLQNKRQEEGQEADNFTLPGRKEPRSKNKNPK
jgi:hypothetical protein